MPPDLPLKGSPLDTLANSGAGPPPAVQVRLLSSGWACHPTSVNAKCADLSIGRRGELLRTDRRHAVLKKVLAHLWRDVVHGCGMQVAHVLANVITMPCQALSASCWPHGPEG